MANAAAAHTDGREGFVLFLKDVLAPVAQKYGVGIAAYLDSCMPGLGDRWKKMKRGVTRDTFENIVRWGLVGKVDQKTIQTLEIQFQSYADLTESEDGRKNKVRGDSSTKAATNAKRFEKLIASSNASQSDFSDPGYFLHWSTDLLFSLSKQNRNKDSINSARAILDEVSKGSKSRFEFRDEKQKSAAMCAFLGAACMLSTESVDYANANMFFKRLTAEAKIAGDPTSRAIASVCAASIVRNFKLPFSGDQAEADQYWRVFGFEAYAAANDEAPSVFKIDGLASVAAIELGRDHRFAKQGRHQFTGEGSRMDYVDALLGHLEDEESKDLNGAAISRHVALCLTLSHGFLASEHDAKRNHAMVLLSLSKSRMLEKRFNKHIAWIDWYTCCAAAMKLSGRVAGYATALQRAQELARALNANMTERSISQHLHAVLISENPINSLAPRLAATDDLLEFLSLQPPSLKS
ncbi:MAG: hypothetical protein ABL901_00945 [Hyphomicrobiaceae bacterium]